MLEKIEIYLTYLENSYTNTNTYIYSFSIMIFLCIGLFGYGVYLHKTGKKVVFSDTEEKKEIVNHTYFYFFSIFGLLMLSVNVLLTIFLANKEINPEQLKYVNHILEISLDKRDKVEKETRFQRAVSTIIVYQNDKEIAYDINGYTADYSFYPTPQDENVFLLYLFDLLNTDEKQIVLNKLKEILKDNKINEGELKLLNKTILNFFDIKDFRKMENKQNIEMTENLKKIISSEVTENLNQLNNINGEKK